MRVLQDIVLLLILAHPVRALVASRLTISGGLGSLARRTSSRGALIRQSREHLAAAGGDYFEHLHFASTVGLMAVAAGLACLIHAVGPALCTLTASRTIASLPRLFERRDMVDEIAEESREATAFALLVLLSAVVVAPLWLPDVPNVLRFA